MAKASPLFTKVLVANRGEIACRVIRTCQRLEIPTVAIFTNVDSQSLHVKQADEAVLIPEGVSRHGYLESDFIIQICKDNGADAIHPGYGFLSENAEFVEKVEEAGITFLGPSPESVRKFGLKHVSREIAKEAGVPITPGTGLLDDVSDAVDAADKLGYPVLLKATAGGGGIGMYVCENQDEVEQNFQKTIDQGSKQFGNNAVYVEKFFEKVHHIEVQIFGDGQGQAIHLGERECSVQRRNQKIIEETPSPFIEKNPELRDKVTSAAVRLVKALNYRSAGTVEFIVSDDTGEIFFLEVNTRLQVEHGITELVRGVDIVEMMIRLGSAATRVGKDGDVSSLFDITNYGAENVPAEGHAIEFRIYAENPAKNFLPCPGLLTQISLPDLKYARYDTWIETGTKITPHYDPLLAKIMVKGDSRSDSLKKADKVLGGCRIRGLPTNLEYLHHITKTEDFVAGNTTTRFVETVEWAPQAIEIVQPGAFTTIQDSTGRRTVGFGIPVSGPMDDLGCRIANSLVGNSLDEAVFEITFKGPTLRFHVDTIIGTAGADMHMKLNNGQEIPNWSRVFIPGGSTLTIGGCKNNGVRSYLAVAGGLDIPKYLGSRSTSAESGLGGYQGRKLLGGDFVLQNSSITDLHDVSKDSLTLPDELIPNYTNEWKVYTMAGPQSDPDYLLKEDTDLLFSTGWEVHHNSSRMGVRLLGPNFKWARTDGGEGGSHPSNIHDNGYACPGTINMTGDMPIILTQEGPSAGGFCCIATIVTADLWKIGQAGPHNTIHFVRVTQEQAVELRRRQDQYLQHMQAYCYEPDPRTALESLSSNVADEEKQLKEMFDSGNYRTANILQASINRNRSRISTIELGALKSEKAAFIPRSLEWNGDKLPDSLFSGITEDHAILAQIEENEEQGMIKTIYRQAGDMFIMVEYGEMVIDFNIRARVFDLERILERMNVPGILTVAPNVRTLLIQYDPFIISQTALLNVLLVAEKQHEDIRHMKVPSRIFHFPIAIDDRWTKETVERYAKTTRSLAPYVPSNIDFIVANNGLKDKNEFFEGAVNSPFLIVGVGFYLGTPFCLSNDPRCRYNVPKYNPARTFTYGGTVGIGGAFMAIYGMDSPGGYQIYGRTLPIWDTFGELPHFSPDKPWLFNNFDQLKFYRVSEDELEKARAQCFAGKYEMHIEHSYFDLHAYNEFIKEIEHELPEILERRAACNAEQQRIDAEMLQQLAKEAAESKEKDGVGASDASEILEGEVGVFSDMSANVWKYRVQPGDTVEQDDVVVVLEAMKTEIAVTAPQKGVVDRILVEEGKTVNSGDLLAVIKVEVEE